MNQELAIENKKALLAGAFLLSFYWVIAIWNFFGNFINALGFNATVFILGLLVLFFDTLSSKKSVSGNYSWVIPVALIGLSFSLYENPFLKAVSVFFLPFIISIFFANALRPKNNKWSIESLVMAVINRILFLTKISEALKIISGKMNVKGGNSKIIFKIIFGLFLFLAIASTIIVPLLSAADPIFGGIMRDIMQWLYDIIAFQYFGRLIFAILFGVFLMSFYLSFDAEKKVEEKAEIPPRLMDPVVSGIVLGGILLVYIIFLLTQLSHLWIDRLPFVFKDTERLVKSGFWQLLFISVINIVFFIGYYRKTNNFVQNILKIFSIASILILVSAGQRMFLYVFYYGLSYEKFFASYTVIFCFLVFAWLIYQLFGKKQGDILKFIALSLLWMYSILTILPVERIVFDTNITLSQRKDSRINLYELKMLSSDVLPLVTSYRQDREWQEKWCGWIGIQTNINDEKRWYEKNIGNLAAGQLPKNWSINCREIEAAKNNESSESQKN